MTHEIVEQYDKLYTDQSNWRGLWDEVSTYCLPDRGDFNKAFGIGLDKGGQRRRQNLFDSTAEHSVEVFASSIMGIVANQTTKWFSLDVAGIDISKDKDAQMWLADAADVCLDAFNESDSKFYDHLHNNILDLGAFGTSAISIEKGEDTLIQFKALSPRDFVFMEGASGLADTVYTKKCFTKYKLMQMEGWTIPEIVSKEADQTKTFDVITCISPNPDADSKSLTERKYKMKRILVETEDLLDEGTFDTFPIPVARWKVGTGEEWGRSPAMKALSDTKTLNSAKKGIMIAAEKQINPPMAYHNSFGKMNLGAGGRNAVDMEIKDGIKQIQTIGDVNITFEFMQELKQAIRTAFFIDIFQTADSVDMTATEANIRQTEKMRILAPNIARINSELIGQIVQRVFGILLAEGLFPPIPESITGREIKVKYESPMTKSQRVGDFQNIMGFAGSIGQIAEVSPKVLQKIDFDAMVDELQEASGIPASLIRSDEELEALRKASQEEEAQQAQLDQIEQGTQAASNIGIQV